MATKKTTGKLGLPAPKKPAEKAVKKTEPKKVEPKERESTCYE